MSELDPTLLDDLYPSLRKVAKLRRKLNSTSSSVRAEELSFKLNLARQDALRAFQIAVRAVLEQP